MPSAVTIFSRGALITMSLSLLMGICNYLTRRHLSIHLSTADFGLLYSSFNLFNIVAALADLGLNNTITLLIPSYSSSRHSEIIPRLFKKILFFKIISAVLITGLFLLSSRLLCLYYYKYEQGIAVFRILAFYCISYQLLLFLMAALNGLKHFISMNLLQLMFYLFPLVFLCIAASYPTNQTLAIILGEFTGMAAVILCLKLSDKNTLFSHSSLPLPGSEIPSWRQLLQTSSWFALGNLTLTVISCLDVLLLTSQKGVTEAGIYNIAMSISMIITPLTVVSNLAMPIISSCWKEHQTDEIKKLVSFFFCIFTLIFWCGSIFFILFSDDLISLLFSDRFLKASPALSILGPAFLLNIGLLFTYNVLNGLDQYRRANLLLLTSIPVNALINLLLVPKWGLIGAALGTFSGFLFAGCLMYILLCKKAGIQILSLKQNLAGIILTGITLTVPSCSFPMRTCVFIITGLCLLSFFLKYSDIDIMKIYHQLLHISPEK